MTKKIFLTGRPGSGKTTAALFVARELERLGFKVGGVVSNEVRSGGERVGFELKDLKSGRRGWLARVGLSSGPRLGKYRVNLKDLAEVGAASIEEAEADPEVKLIVIDELGPMEFFSDEFKGAVERVIEGDKPLLATIHYKLKDRFLRKLTGQFKVFEVTRENRNEVRKEVLKEVLAELGAEDRLG